MGMCKVAITIEIYSMNKIWLLLTHECIFDRFKKTEGPKFVRIL